MVGRAAGGVTYAQRGATGAGARACRLYWGPRLPTNNMQLPPPRAPGRAHRPPLRHKQRTAAARAAAPARGREEPLGPPASGPCRAKPRPTGDHASGFCHPKTPAPLPGSAAFTRCLPLLARMLKRRPAGFTAAQAHKRHLPSPPCPPLFSESRLVAVTSVPQARLPWPRSRPSRRRTIRTGGPAPAPDTSSPDPASQGRPAPLSHLRSLPQPLLYSPPALTRARRARVGG